MKTKKKAPPIDFIIDGTNVCGWHETNIYESNNGKAQAEFTLRPLLKLVIALNKKGKSFHCWFDASTLSMLNDDEAVIYNKLLKEYNENFYQVIGGIKADPFVLSSADKFNASVISNDSFGIYIDKYPWLDRNKKPVRLFKGGKPKLAGENHLMLPHLDINEVMEESVEELYNEFIYAFQNVKKGKIKSFSQKNGWGFILGDDGQEIYFNKKSFMFEEGLRVEFELGQKESGELFTKNVKAATSELEVAKEEVASLKKQLGQLKLVGINRKSEKLQIGQIEWYNPAKGFGVIKMETKKDESIFFYKTEFLDQKLEPVANMMVVFELGRNKKGACATKIESAPEDFELQVQIDKVKKENDRLKRELAKAKGEKVPASKDQRSNQNNRKDQANKDNNKKGQQQPPQQAKQNRQDNKQQGKQQQNRQDNKQQGKQQQNRQDNKQQGKQQQNRQDNKQQGKQQQNHQDNKQQGKQQQNHQDNKQQGKQQQNRQDNKQQGKQQQNRQDNKQQGKQQNRQDNKQQGKQQQNRQDNKQQGKQQQNRQDNKQQGKQQNRQDNKQQGKQQQNRQDNKQQQANDKQSGAKTGGNQPNKQGTKNGKAAAIQNKRQEEMANSKQPAKAKKKATNSPVYTGVVMVLDKEGGKIKPDKAKTPLKFIMSEIEPSVAAVLAEGTKVEFTIGRSRKGLTACNLSLSGQKVEAKKETAKQKTTVEQPAKKQATAKKETTKQAPSKKEAAAESKKKASEEASTKGKKTRRGKSKKAKPQETVAETKSKAAPKKTAEAPKPKKANAVNNGANPLKKFTSIEKRKQWWRGLEEQWQVAFNIFASNKRSKAIPTDAKIKAILTTEEFNVNDISLPKKFTNLSGLSELTMLQKIDVSDQELKNLKGIEALSELLKLNCKTNKLTTISGIDKFKKLVYLDCSFNKLKKLNGVDQLKDLEVLICGSNPLGNIKGLKKLEKIKKLHCFNNGLESLEEIEGMSELEFLNFSYNPIDTISSVSGLKKMKQLAADYCQLTSLNGIGKLAQLQSLDVENNQLKDLKGIGKLHNLARLNCYNNELTYRNVQIAVKLDSLKMLNLKDNKLKPADHDKIKALPIKEIII